MATLQSVGVQVTETDLTPVTQPVSASTGAYVGHFNWGPALELVNVVSETVLGKIFGTPSKKDDMTSGSFLTAESFLKYGNSLKVLRTLDTATARNAKGEVYLYGTSEETLCIPNKTEFDIKSSTLLTSPFYARYAGSLGNSLSLQVFHANNVGTTATESKKFFSTTASTTLWASEVSETPITNDEVHIVIYDELGLITGSKGTVLETWEGLSLAPNARASSGINNYWMDVINTGSSYVYVGNATDVATVSNNTTFSFIANAVPGSAITGGNLYVRPTGQSYHRPFDGGVQLGTGGPAHGAHAVRQSKKYIRYQSGKGVTYNTGALFAFATARR